MPDNVIIFIPGIMGSRLSQGGMVWPARDEHDAEALRIFGVPPSVTFVDGVLKQLDVRLRYFEDYPYPVAGTLIDFLRNSLGCYVDEFAYDWRRSVLESGRDLIDRIRQYPNATLVCHSMGGLVAKAAVIMAEDAGDPVSVKRLITLGTPWLGAPEAYLRLKYGRSWPTPFPALKWVSAAKIADLARSVPSTYELLPFEEYFSREDGFALGDKGIVLGYAQSKALVEREFSMPDIFPNLIEPTHHVLSSEWPSRIPHVNIIGSGCFTVGTVNDQMVFHLTEKRKVQARHINGDGTVPLSSAIPLNRAKLYHVKSNHLRLLKNEAVRRILAHEIAGMAIPEDAGVLTEPAPLNGKVIRAACPVRVIVSYDGKLVGPVDAQSLSQLADLPDVDYEVIGDAKYIVIPDDSGYQVKMEGFASGHLSLGVLDWKAGTPSQAYTFERIAVDTSTTATLSFQPDDNNEPVISLKQDRQRAAETVLPQGRVAIDRVNITPSHSCRIVLDARDTEKALLEDGRTVFKAAPTLHLEALPGTEAGILEMWYQVNEGPALRYRGPGHLENLREGENFVVAVATDSLGRDQLQPSQAKFWIDSMPPVTKPLVTLAHDLIAVHLRAEETGNKGTGVADTYYLSTQGPKKFERPLKFRYVDRETVSFWSVDHVGNVETVRDLPVNGPEWSEIWAKDFLPQATFQQLADQLRRPDDDPLAIVIDARPVKDFHAFMPSVDDIGEITIETAQATFVISVNPKYELFWVRPPVEWVTRGQDLELEFVLASPLGSSVTSTSPRAYIQPMSKRGKHGRLSLPIRQEGDHFVGLVPTGSMSFIEEAYRIVLEDVRKHLRTVKLQLHAPTY